MLEPCLERVIEVQVDQDSEPGKRGFKAKERDLSRCEGYMYRRKGER